MNSDEIMRTDFYALLDIPVDASSHDIRKQFRKLSKQYHPDKIANQSSDDIDAMTAKYEMISMGYSILSDPELRKEYDQLYFVEKQIKDHGSLKQSFDKYKPQALTEADVLQQQTDFLERQQQFINKSKFSEADTADINAKLKDLIVAREHMPMGEKVKNIDKSISEFRQDNEKKYQLSTVFNPVANNETSEGATLNADTFGSPFADMNNPDESGDVSQKNAEYGFIDQPSIVPISQAAIDSYNIKRDIKTEQKRYDEMTEKIPNWVKQDERAINEKLNESKLVNDILKI